MARLLAFLFLFLTRSLGRRHDLRRTCKYQVLYCHWHHTSIWNGRQESQLLGMCVMYLIIPLLVKIVCYCEYSRDLATQLVLF